MREEILQIIIKNVGTGIPYEKIADKIMELAEVFIQKADKWDELDKEIGEYYETYDEEGNEIAPAETGDLCDIGEVAASAFGYL